LSLEGCAAQIIKKHSSKLQTKLATKGSPLNYTHH